jgi:peptide alpha-N-acetyltransferase
VNGIRYDTYQDESQMQAIMELFAKDLSEPYSIYTYRYFINNWPRLCVLVLRPVCDVRARLVSSLV